MWGGRSCKFLGKKDIRYQRSEIRKQGGRNGRVWVNAGNGDEEVGTKSERVFSSEEGEELRREHREHRVHREEETKKRNLRREVKGRRGIHRTKYVRWKTVPRLRDPTRQNTARKKKSGRSARDDMGICAAESGAIGMIDQHRGDAPTALEERLGGEADIAKARAFGARLEDRDNQGKRTAALQGVRKCV